MQLKTSLAMPFALALLALLATTTIAQSTSSTSSPAASTSSTITLSADAATVTASGSATTTGNITHTISVGYAGFTFQPMTVLAEVGDTIEFDFYPTNHSVARAEYGYPCIPYEDTGIDKIGFFSGFEQVDAILPDPPKFSIRVNDTDPIFFYCTAPNSCIGFGMVGGINPTANETVASQQQLAFEASFMLQPGEPWPSESDPFTTTAGSAAATSTTASSTMTSATAAATTTAAAVTSSSHHSSGLSGGAIAGIAIGGVAALALLGGFFYFCGRNRTLSDRLGRNHDQQDHLNNRDSVLSGMTQFTNSQQAKHMSEMSSRPDSEMRSYFPNGGGPPSHPGSPGLPQYAHMMHQDQGQRSPSLRGGFDTLSPLAGDGLLARSPSPSQGQGQGQVPAYSAVPYELPPDSHTHGPHEMEAPIPSDKGQGGRNTTASPPPPLSSSRLDSEDPRKIDHGSDRYV